eukprot:Nk52_evm23s304 gene=Nk52_evmTU23s304
MKVEKNECGAQEEEQDGSSSRATTHSHVAFGENIVVPIPSETIPYNESTIHSVGSLGNLRERGRLFEVAFGLLKEFHRYRTRLVLNRENSDFDESVYSKQITLSKPNLKTIVIHQLGTSLPFGSLMERNNEEGEEEGNHLPQRENDPNMNDEASADREIVLNIEIYCDVEGYVEDVIDISLDGELLGCISITAKTLRKGSGTPLLKTGVHCIGCEDTETDLDTDWKGF